MIAIAILSDTKRPKDQVSKKASWPHRPLPAKRSEPAIRDFAYIAI
jgi:hypothetical protein